MKKNVKKIFLLFFISLFVFMVYNVILKISYKREVAENIKTIPEFAFQNSKGGIFSNQNLKKNTPTIFIYYNSECEFCNEEAQMIKENIEKFINFQLIFISFEKPELIKTFAAKYQLTTYDNVVFLYDSKASFSTTFDVKSLPCLVLYDKNQRLIEKVKGQVKTETIIKKLRIKD